MIRKFMICGKKQIYIQSKNSDGYTDIGKVIELLLPINDFWELEKEVKKINYLTASDAPSVDVGGQYKKILGISSGFAVVEADRLWLYAHRK
ncbi:MAG: hypothetical protein H7249_07835 [Chitinophagaceae bacterium]|nr:hypothetical protein [Oligoflexus sp.]